MDDPYELLGVPHDATEREIKRAYARLLRVHRPDRDPAGFRRLREAYETALRWAEDGVESEAADGGDGRPYDAYDLPDDAAEDPSLEEVQHPRDHAEVKPRFWERVLEAGMDFALEESRAAERADPQACEPYTQQFLAAEVSGRPFLEAARPLVRGLNAGAPLLEWMETVLTEDELSALARSNYLSWKRARRWRNRRAATVFWERRCVDLFCDGRIDDLQRQLSGEEVRKDAAKDDRLAAVGRSLAEALVLDEPAMAQQLHEHYTPYRAGGEALDEFEERLELVDFWAGVKDSVPTALAIYIRLRPVARADQLRQRIDAAGGWDWANTAAAIAAWKGPRERLLFLFESDVDTVVLGDVEPDDEPALTRFAEATDRSIASSRHNLAATIALVVCSVVTVALFRSFGVWWGCGALLASLVVWLPMLFLADGKTYAAVIRPQLIRLLAKHGLSRASVAAWIKDNSKLTDELGRFDDEMERDVSLDIVACLARRHAE